jgi:hypothetical protein
MDSLQIINALSEAIEILTAARTNLSDAPIELWQIPDHAISHLRKQIKVQLGRA